MSTPSRCASSRAWAVARTLKATITALEALASWMSLSVIWPTEASSTRTFTSSCSSLSTVAWIASALPCTSALMRTATSFCAPAAMRASIWSSVPRARRRGRPLPCRAACAGGTRRSRARGPRSRPRRTARRPRARPRGRGSRPASTARRPSAAGPCRRASPARGPIRRRRPRCRPGFSVPFCTSTVATGPRPRSSRLSMTEPSAARSGLALRSRISACSEDRLRAACRGRSS